MHAIVYAYPRLWPTAVLLSAISAPVGTAAEDSSMSQPTSTAAFALPTEGQFPSLARATAWLNSEPLNSEGLRGKVVLVDFWTYSCINWRRTVPYLRAWTQKYKDRGLVVIGVHTPEFGFEKDLDNVRRHAKEQNVDYPIAVDSDYGIWQAFHNRYWPALYFIDAQGRVRHHVFGEGEYEQSERIIQQLLSEAGHTVADRRLVTLDARGAEAGADWKNLRSPETYVGYGRAERFVSPGREVFDQAKVYPAPVRLGVNDWALSGEWTIRKELTESNKANAKLTYRFHARDLHLVMGPATRGTPVRFRVLIDGLPPGASHGVDIDDQGHGTLDQPRMYQLIRQSTPITDREFEIEFLDAGAEVFSVTFG
jgi:thiol-disulfide isomerase/thioredoxin